MGNRLSQIATRTGDDGTTGLADGTRVTKDHLRVAAMGDVDELNSSIGVLLTTELSDSIRSDLAAIQNDLFDLGGELSLPGHSIMSLAHVTRLERELDRLNARLSPLKDFILPAGTRGAGLAHVARTVCRRAERRVVALARKQRTAPALTAYLNRLSDLLFVVARELNRAEGRPDVLWKQGKNRTRDGG
jgi:cob(I)alamin adenosyltransferase